MCQGSPRLGRALSTAALTILALVAAPAPAMAVLTVDAGGDLAAPAENNQCVLREAVQFANTDAASNDDCGTPAMGADEINFAAALSEIDLSVANIAASEEANASGDLDVTDTLTIRDTSGTVTIDGNDLDRVIDRPPGGATDLVLENLTVTNGTTDPDDSGTTADGGAIRFNPTGPAGNLTLTNVDVTNSVARDVLATGRGGGVRANTAGTVTIQSGSTISGNRAGGGAAAEPGQGGGVSVAGANTDLVISNSTITDNDAGGGFPSLAVSFGGGLIAGLTDAATLTMTNTTVTSNEVGGRNADTDGLGGGVHLSGGGAPGLDAQITGGTVNDNRAGGAGEADGTGGGISASGGLSDFDLNGVTVQGNQAGGQGAGGDGLGGGLHSQSSVGIADSTFFQNRAGADGTAGVNGWGGAIRIDGTANPSLTMSGSLLQGNVAGTTAIGQAQGGGIYMESLGTGALSISNSTLLQNSVRSASSPNSPRGGGVYRSETDGASTPTDTLTNVAVVANSAGDANGAGGGAGLAFASSGILELTGTTVRGNTASAPSAGAGGGILFQSALNSAAGSMQQGTLRLTNSTVSTNTATSASPPLNGQGGGIFTNDNTSQIAAIVQLTSSTIANNTASNDGGTGFGGNLMLAGVQSGDADIQGSIITGGSGAAGAQNCSVEIPTAVDSLGGSVEGPPSTTSQCQLDAGSDLVGVDPLLGPLVNNGGFGETHAVPAGSPAIDRVPAFLCPPPATDQRGTARPQGPACDSGAYEFAPPVATPPIPPAAMPPTTPAAPPKKCKKGRKLKKGRCVKKKKRKKRT